jgi:hypothetical protein
MIVVLQETRTIYRSAVGRRARFTRKAAYLDAAWQAWRAKYPCQCESETGYVCDNHYVDCRACVLEAADVVPGIHGVPHAHEHPSKKTVDRLARWLQWRDRRVAALALEASEC